VDASPEKPVFDPFNTRHETESPLREVIKNPTRAEVMKTGPLPEFSIGRPDAPVTIIKYMSLTCPYCRRFQAETFPVLKKEYIDTGKVRFIIREFPIGKTSGNATIALRCAPMDKYLTLYGKFLQQQSAWVSQEVRPDAIFKVAQQVGMTRDQFDSCLKNQGMIAGLKWVKDRGRQLGVIGTPNFFIENRLVKKVIDMNDIREMVDPLIASRSAAAPTR
jgi:protein-disulfide isomerase